MRRPLVRALLLAASLAPGLLRDPGPALAQERVPAIPFAKRLEELTWSRLFPALGARSPRIATLRIDPRTKATQVLIRFEAGFHVPLHWHTSNESQMIVRGHVTVETNGVRSELDRGDFNYIPAKMPHESWIHRGGALIYIVTDGAWDYDWVGREPTRSDFFRKPAEREEN